MPLIDISIVRVRQHGACITKNISDQWDGHGKGESAGQQAIGYRSRCVKAPLGLFLSFRTLWHERG